MQHVRMADAGLTREASSSSKDSARRQAIHKLLVPFSVAYFTGAFVTDVLYWRTEEVTWERFSVWLITIGLIMAGLAAIAALIDVASGRQKPAWPPLVGYALAVFLSLANVFIHSRDGYTAVVPTGLMLSGFVVVILLAMAPAAWALTSPHAAGRAT
ncbi:DUF2231 domain-containing protein [Bradyrhizobium tropiciagri]|uniref:DUF2231 domain-containing protein n=1 Tax=Bradyrhizobium tropiciagri TaxID=312253 RepID=UPI000A5D728B|nr:DUF2231 domain-containing protein [Bradyrhizobium tropiciagri]